MSMIKDALSRFLATVSVASIALLTFGCDGDGEASGLDGAQRQARASSEIISMTDAELEKAMEADNAARQKGVAANVANRLIATDPVDQLQQELTELGSQIQGDEAQRQAALERLLTFNQNVSGQITGFLTQANETRDQRLANAVKLTEDVLRDDPENPAAAWLLATIKLMQGRLMWQELNSQSVELQKQFLVLCRLAKQIQTEKIVQTNLAHYVPDEAIVKLQQRLENGESQGSPSLRTQLAAVKDTLAKLKEQREKVQQLRQENQQVMEQTHKQYMELLSQAENLRGQERFQLEQQAYALRGAGENAAPTTLHDYEARIEQADDELRMLDTKIALQQLNHDQLESGIAEIEQRITNLKTADIHNQVRLGLDESTSRLAVLNEQFEQEWKKSLTFEQSYSDQRLETVNAFNEAVSGFSRAQKNLENPRRQQADKMIKMVHGDLMRLWNQDAAHYDNAAMVMAALETAAVMNEAVSSQRATFEAQANSSRISAEKEAALAGAEEKTESPEAPSLPAEEAPLSPEAPEPAAPAVPADAPPADASSPAPADVETEPAP